MKLRFVSLFSTDKLKLPGLLYTPDKPTKKAAVWLHGMGDSGAFYNPERINALGIALREKGIALLVFNNRGAHGSKSLMIFDESLPEERQRYQAGTYYERIADSVPDIDGAAGFLKDKGYSELYLMGHSSGANKICVYDTLSKQNNFSRYVLAGAGDDVGLMYLQLGEKKFWRAQIYAKSAIDSGQPQKIMPKFSGMHPFSAQSTWDYLDPDGYYNTFPLYEAAQKKFGNKPLFEEYSKITKPMLVVYGENDESTITAGGAGSALAILRQYTNPKALPASDLIIIPDTDHGFHGQEKLFAETVAVWLNR